MQEIPHMTLKEAARGDERAFEQLYSISSGFVYTVAYRIVNNPEKAADITQEVFLKIYKHLKSFQFRSSFKTWLYRITVNTSLTIAERHQKHTKGLVSYDDAVDYHRSPEAAAAPPADTDSKEHLGRLLEKLNPDQRACIILREIEGLSYKEIAKALRTNINTVRTRLLRARQTLMRLNKNEVISHEV